MQAGQAGEKLSDLMGRLMPKSGKRYQPKQPGYAEARYAEARRAAKGKP